MLSEEIFEAFLNCETKASLNLSMEAGHQQEADIWRKRFDEDYRRSCFSLVLTRFPGESYVGSPAVKDLKNGKYKLLIDCLVQAEGLQSRIHALERVTSSAKVDAGHYIPLRFVRSERITRHDKLLLAFDAIALSKLLGRAPQVGKIIHGKNFRSVKVRFGALTQATKLIIERITDQTTGSPPQLFLNKHCGICEFQETCRRAAIEKDELSLLSTMTRREIKTQHEKGIFTVAQLSYTYRPRRLHRHSIARIAKYDPALKALAIREQRIYITGRPEFQVGQPAVYLDVEGLPEDDFYYLIGLRIKCGDSYLQRSFWANDKSEEKVIWNEFLETLSKFEQPQIIHYGAYETVFLKRMRQRYVEDELIDKSVGALIGASINLLSVTHAQVYFPTYSNGLKDIASFLGFQWSEPRSSGLVSIAWRYGWESSKDPSLKRRLLTYNAEDCEALERVADTVAILCCGQSETRESNRVVHTETLKAKTSYRFGVNEFSMPELNYINRCAYWDYQRDKIYVRSDKRLRRLSKPRSRDQKNAFPINKTVECPLDISCPKCQSDRILKYGRMRKAVYDIKFGPSGVRRWVVNYSFNRYRCSQCRATFVSQHRPLIKKYGSQLLAYLIYQIIELQIPQLSVAENIRELFQFRMFRGEVHRQKVRAAELYQDASNAILQNIVNGRLVHADETSVNIQGKRAFVWVLTNMEEVFYFYTETRGGERVHDLLREFRGVLVSDFYTAYDSIDCPQQKCLIHLIRDLNDDLIKHPFDQELRELLREFALLLRPIIESVDKFGLKTRFLRRHKLAVDRFYQRLYKRSFQSDTVTQYQKRFKKYRNKLFTFLDHDGVPWNNNNAEHAIKAFAGLRNVIRGSSSDKGIQEYLTLLSVCQTCKYKGVSFLEFLRTGLKDVDAYVQAHDRRSRRR